MPRSSLIITVDRLNPSLLGPYGGTLTSTPNFNRLAAQSLVIETAISDAADLETVFRSYWQGIHAAAPTPPETQPSVIELLRDAQVRTVLVTDEPLVAAHPLAEFFTQRIQLPAAANTHCAADVEATHIAESLAAALDIFTELASPFLFWIHLQGLAAPWDAPLELRERLRSDDDPEASSDARVPSLRLAADYDPDWLLSITQAYAAQVMLLDMALGVLLEAVEAHAARDDLLLLCTSPRGFPLGEHLLVGDCETALYGELLHVPLLMRQANGVGALSREPALVQPADIAATLADWFEVPRPAPSPEAASLLSLTADSPARWPREQTLSVAAGERATRTPAWFLRQADAFAATIAGDVAAVELFSKPDDRYEANEISSLCPLIAEQLTASIAIYEQALVAHDFMQLAPLAPDLVGGVGN